MKEIWTNAFGHVTGSFEFMTVAHAVLAAVVLLAIMKKTGLMRRVAKWHQTLVCVYYFYIPVLFAVTGVAWATVGSMEGAMLTTIEEARPAISRTSVEYAGAAWKIVAEKLAGKSDISLREMCLTVTRDYANKLLEGFSAVSRFSAFMQPVTDAVQEGVALSLARVVEEDIIGKAADMTRLDTETLRAIWTADLAEAMQGGLVGDILVGQTKRAFKPGYRYIAAMFFLFLLPVALETAWAVYRRRKTGTA